MVPTKQVTICGVVFQQYDRHTWMRTAQSGTPYDLLISQNGPNDYTIYAHDPTTTKLVAQMDGQSKEFLVRVAGTKGWVK